MQRTVALVTMERRSRQGLGKGASHTLTARGDVRKASTRDGERLKEQPTAVPRGSWAHIVKGHVRYPGAGPEAARAEALGFLRQHTAHSVPFTTTRKNRKA